MQSSSFKGRDLSRRGFLAGVAGAGAALAGLTSVTRAKADEIEWAEEADIVVVGFGGAGTSAAIEAARAGSSVILVEKAPEEEAGGNTSVSGGGWITIVDGMDDLAFEFFKAQMPWTIDDAEIWGYMEELKGTSAWIETLGATPSEPSGAGLRYPGLHGSEAIGGRVNTGGTGLSLYGYLKSGVEAEPNIRVFYETPATDLIFDQATHEVFGIWAVREGELIAIKAKQAVILGIGGYEAAPEIMAQYLAPGTKIYPWGTPYNTGDGLHMIMEVGAKPRHFASVEWGTFNCKAASEETGLAVSFSGYAPQFKSAILVNKYGKRFMAEDAYSGPYPVPVHSKAQLPILDFDVEKIEYANLPMYMVFDEARREYGCLFEFARPEGGCSWAGLRAGPLWSEDNLEEIEKGWVLKADTIEELAELAGIDPVALAEEVAAWNAAVEAGEDTAWGRTTQMDPIVVPPFYITELGLSIINTQGGADRDAEHRVLGWDGQPIPRLYAGGEFGSIYGWLYQGAGNVPEALGNRVAGAHAATLSRWDEE